MEHFDWMRIVYLLLLLMLIAPAVLAGNRRRWLRNTAIWLAVLVGLVFIYQSFGPF